MSDASLRTEAAALGMNAIHHPEWSDQSWLQRVGRWWAEAFIHAFGNPREEAAHQPPLVGVQPYRDRPNRRRR